MLRDAFLRAEKRLTRFLPGGPPEAKCVSCIRKRYGGPSCCAEGWDRWREGRDSGGCANWVGWDTMAGPKPATDAPGGAE